MDQGLKERLVGAAVLVAIGVWLIPWVLDGPETPLDTGANSLQLPPAEEPMPMRTQTLRLGEVAEPAADTAVPPSAAPGAEPQSVAARDTEPVAEAPEPVVAAAPSAAPQVSAPAAAAAPPPAAPSVTAARGAGAGGDWVVQLGSFGEEANARRVAQRAGTFGYKAEVTSLRSNGRTLYRVRVGPSATRAEADATASALRAHGIEARVVAAN
jgi:DedD protein